MSKEAAMAMLTGQPVTQVNHSLITGDMNAVSEQPETRLPEAPAVSDNAKITIPSDREAMLVKKEAKIVREREEYKRELALMQQEKQKIMEINTQYQAFLEKKKTDPVAALKDLEFTEADLFNFMAGQEKKEPTMEELAEAAATRKMSEWEEKQAKLAQEVSQKQDEVTLTKYETNIQSVYKSDPDKYELSLYYPERTKEYSMWVATEHILKDGNDPLKPHEVADIVEAMYEGELERMKNLKKMKNHEAQMLQDPSVVKQEPVRTRTLQTNGVVQTQAPKTITNKATATLASRVVRQETSEQKRARLIDKLRNG